MSTTAAFFAGEGEGARFLGGHYSDGYIQEDESRGGVPVSILEAKTEKEFCILVGLHMMKVSEDDKMSPLTWATAKGIQYLYCFFEGHTWVTDGGRWFNDHIPADIKPSKATPPAPVCRVGKLGVDVAVECGQCRNNEVLNHQEFEAKHTDGWSLTDIYAYFQAKGWKSTEEQGWLCPNCIS